jgi:PAS domain S-box-containing protein
MGGSTGKNELSLGSEGRYRLLLDHAGLGIGYFDLEGTILLINRRGCELLQADASELIGRGAVEVFGPEMGEKVLERIFVVAGGWGPRSFEDEVDLPNGRRCFESIYTEIPDEEGVPVGVQVVSHDVTRLKRAEQERRRSEQEKELILGSTREMFAYYDTDLRILWANKASADSVGMQVSEMIGRRCYEIWHGRDEPCPVCPVLTALETGQPQEEEVTSPDGRHWRLRGYPVRDESGQVIRLIEFGEDITAGRRAQEALRASEGFLRSTLDGLSAHIALLDEQGKILLVNRAWRTFAEENEVSAGAVSEGANYLRACDEAAGEDADLARRFAEGTRSVLAGRANSFEMEYPCHSPRQQRWFVARVTPFAGEGPRRVVVAHENITQRKLAVGRLADSERLARTLLNATTNAVNLLDDDGIIIDLNEGMARAFGRPREELIGTCAFDRFPPEEARAKRELVARVLHERKPLRLEEESLGHRLDTVIQPIDAPPGAKARVAVFAHDITDRVEAERALRETENRLRAILNAQPQAVVLQDTEMRIVWPNRAACEAAGMTREELIGRYCYDIYAQVESPCQGCPVSESMRTGQTTTRVRRARQDRVWRIIGSPLRDDAGRIVGAVEISEDITVQQRLEEQLRHSQKMEAVGQLAGGVAHDFRNQLTVIKWCADRLVRHALVSEEGAEEVEEILKAADRSAELTGQLLAFSRRDMLRPRVVDLAGLLADMEGLLRRIVGEDIQVILKETDRPAAVEVDPNQFQQAIVNLAVNARDAMSEKGGELCVSLGRREVGSRLAEERGGRPGEYVVVSVADSGAGMDEETREKAFDPFFTTKEVGKGTGLGLSMVHGFVHQSGGFVEVRSTPGEGTTFHLCFRVAEQPAEGRTDQEGELPEEGEGGRRRVLVVEDEPALRHLLRGMLEDLGYRVLEAAGPVEAERVVADAGHIDLVLTDIIMPEGRGTDLSQRLTALAPRAAVVYTSGYGGEDLTRRGVDSLDAPLLRKPFTREELARCIQDAFRRSAGR